MAAVCGALDAHGAGAVVLDTATLDECDYLVSGQVVRVLGEDGREEVVLDAGTRGWVRRLARPLWRLGVTSGSREAAVRGAHVALLVGLAADAEVQWLSHLASILWADNKLVQMRVASRIGLRVPPAVVCSRARDVPDSLGDPLVLKPLGAGHFVHEGAERVVFARAIGRTELHALPLAGAPFLIQSLIPADRHLRIVTVRDRAWVASLDARGLPLDWRADERAHTAFSAETDPELAARAVKLASRLGLGYSSQDWIVSAGEAWVIDVNPSGQWLFLPEPIASEVTGQIAGWLAGGTA